MKFLVTIIQKQPPPPEIMPALIEATIQWMAQAKGGGKFDAIYSIARAAWGTGYRRRGQPRGVERLNREVPDDSLL